MNNRNGKVTCTSKRKFIGKFTIDLVKFRVLALCSPGLRLTTVSLDAEFNIGYKHNQMFLQYDVTITNEIFQNMKHLNSNHTVFFPLLNRTLKL